MRELPHHVQYTYELLRQYLRADSLGLGLDIRTRRNVGFPFTTVLKVFFINEAQTAAAARSPKNNKM